MGLLGSLVSSRHQDVDRSDSGSDDYFPPPDRLKTIYSGISVTFSTRVTEPPKRRWKPVSIRAPVLVPFILVSLVLGALVEYLAQRSDKEGGLSLAPDADNASAGVILSRYAPTAIAVIYSLTWTWIDLDIRRIQPWLEMSKEEGGTAESTLLLDYPFEFLAFIPVKAWRNKHSLVFLAGTIMMLVFWAVTPLQSAIFGTQSVSIMKQLAASDIAQLGTPEQQLDALDSSILNTAYGITWLRQPFPAFTTATHAFVPFQPMEPKVAILPDETWTAPATSLSTDLKCWPAVVDKTDLSNTFDFDNGQGCKATLAPSSHGRFGNETGIIHTVLYIGYHENAQLDWYLQNPNCSTAASHQFLAIWIAQDTKDMTALFCEPSYWKQSVMVTISADDKTPDESSLIPLGDAEPLGESEFNSTAFEYLIGTGVPPKQMRRDYPRDLKVLEQYPTLSAFNLAWPITNMVGFALGGMNYSVTDLKDDAALHDLFSAAHKKLFSAAIPSLVHSVDVSSSTRQSTVQYTLYGVVVNRPLALTVEILLLVISILATAILRFSYRTDSVLTKDPGRMGATMAVLGDSDTLLKDFAPRDRYGDAALRRSVQGNRYKLVQTATANGDILRIEYTSISENNNASEPDPNTVSGKPMHPQALKPLTGLTFVVTLLAGIIVLLYLKKQETTLGGLPRPTDNFTVLQLLENYVPTIFATLVEPFFVLLNRLLCLLQPFHDLRRGRKPAAKAFETPYTSLPPQLALWQSMRSGHMLLASLCLVSLLANVLAVALGALFNESPVTMGYSRTVQQTLSDTITQAPFQADFGFLPVYDHFYVAAANLSAGTRLSPWTDAEFAYLPFSTTPEAGDNTSSLYQAQTKGFGVDVTCSPFSTSPDLLPYVDYSLHDDGSQSIYFLFPRTDGPVVNCSTIRGLDKSGWLDVSKTSPRGTIAQELVSSLYPSRTFINGTEYLLNDGAFCDRKLVFSWMRIDPANRNGTQSASHMYCVPTWRSATFDVTVDHEGYVLEASQLGDFDDIDSTTRNQTDTVLTTINENIGGGAAVSTTSEMSGPADDDGWHNDTLTRDWMNYFLKLKLNTTNLIDPAQPVPGLNTTFGPVEDLYKMLVANIVGLHSSSLFKSSASPTQIPGTQIVRETRIFMDETAFIISIVILGLMVIVATALYIRESRPFLPRLPSTIGSLLAYVAASQAVKEYTEREKRTRRGEDSTRINVTYSFGKYLGMDGKEHVGVELDPFVAPADDGARVRCRGLFNRSKRKSQPTLAGPDSL
ncbi:hypothetical protein CONLIGDRAFT_367130 [Coniochaeta ligniaria NRRL 30616]|uniref:Uncharacterized protein n=1 Tax=Coniochaeta ligniaria NRRL 30616 TaxID=1408157 RepID=A0A1J7IT77_9PEZI|nr:hypothetical protein CONLIGDRAFT_367130 [Coniochaeta ligniaria NRRL 30616]